jgi:hypothetical protein
MGHFIKRALKWNTGVRASFSNEFIESSIFEPLGYQDLLHFTHTKLYKLWMEERKTAALKHLTRKGFKIVTWQPRIIAGYDQDDFIHNLISVVQKGYAVRVPRFVKNYHLLKNKQYANNVRIMRR